MTCRSCFASVLLSYYAFACAGQSASNAKSDPSDDSSSSNQTNGLAGTDGGTDGGTSGGTTVCKAPAVVSSNPPSCPDYLPGPTECPEAGLACEYDSCAFPTWGAYHLVTCTNGSWETTIERVCEQAPACPLAPPVAGGPCNEALMHGQPCEMRNACADSLPAYCKAGVWEIECTETEPTKLIHLDCPTYPPTLGSPCCPRWYSSTCDFSEFLENGSAASAGSATGGSTSAPWMPMGPIAECVSCNPSSWVWETSDGCE